jgi:hypothetical protein
LSPFCFPPHPNQRVEQVIHVLIVLRHTAMLGEKGMRVTYAFRRSRNSASRSAIQIGRAGDPSPQRFRCGKLTSTNNESGRGCPAICTAPNNKLAGDFSAEADRGVGSDY